MVGGGQLATGRKDRNPIIPPRAAESKHHTEDPDAVTRVICSPGRHTKVSRHGGGHLGFCIRVWSSHLGDAEAWAVQGKQKAQQWVQRRGTGMPAEALITWEMGRHIPEMDRFRHAY